MATKFRRQQPAPQPRSRFSRLPGVGTLQRAATDTERGPRRFFRDTRSELRKVVWPTRGQLSTYTMVVIIFVVIMIGLVTVIDYGLDHAAKYVFG